jgi:hypothetical protein
MKLLSDLKRLMGTRQSIYLFDKDKNELGSQKKNVEDFTAIVQKQMLYIFMNSNVY